MTSTKPRKSCDKDSKKKKCKAAEDPRETAVQNAKLFGFSETQCHNCGVSNDDIGGFLLQCATCKKAYYCGMKCFNENLPFHQKFCITNLLENEPIGRRDIVRKQKPPEEQVEPSKAHTTADASKQKKSKASPNKRNSEATPKKQATVRKTFVDSSCSDSDDETESESESETKADPRTSATGSSANNEGSVCDSSLDTAETLDVALTMRVSTEPGSKSLVSDESFAPDITTKVQDEVAMELVKEE
jgi:MYND finger